MRFGERVHRIQIAQWASFYFNYNAFKRMVKTALTRDSEAEAKAQSIGVLDLLSHEITCVNSFYNDAFARIYDQEKRLPYQNEALHGTLDTLLSCVDERELSEFFQAAAEVREEILNLQWYGKVNHGGLHRILAKLQGAWANEHQIRESVDANLYRLDFKARGKCSQSLKRVESFMSDLSLAIVQTSMSIQERHASLHLHAYLHEVLPIKSLETLYRTIRGDDVTALTSLLSQPSLTKQADRIRAISALSLCCISYGSPLCLTLLLGELAQVDDNMQLDGSLIHQFVIKIGRDRKSSTRQASAASLSENQHSVDLLKDMFQQMQPRQQQAIWEKDSFGRLPIHYAAAYGLPKACLFLLGCMQTRHWDKDQSPDSTEDVLMGDLLGYTALHFAVVGKHTEATKILLTARRNHLYSETNANDEPPKLISGELLAIALSSGSNEIIEDLLDAGIDVTYRNNRGETLPYIACLAGHERWVSRLMDIHSCRTEHINTPELAYGQTPLLIASAQGNLAIVEVLSKAGADHTARNYFGWSALELAAYRGHMAVMRFLRRVLPETTTLAGAPLLSKDLGVSSLPCAGSFRKAKSLIEKNALQQGKDQNTRHETQIVLNLGSLDTRKSSSPAVDLGSYTELDSSHPAYQTSFSLELSVIGAEGPRYIIHLPVLDDKTNMPCVFSAKDPSDVKVSIQVFREGTPVGCGIALLEHLRNRLGSYRESLVRDFTIPILEKDSSRFIGTVTITVIVITPFRHSAVVQPAAVTNVWKNPTCTQLVGHRGLGENFAKSERLQLGENSIQSFLTALDLGATCLELDVQMTKDHVPVIYHDYLTSETGTDSPIHTLSFEQFMYLSKSQSHRNDDRASCADGEASLNMHSQERRHRRALSLSLDASDERKAQDFIDRMRPTFEWEYKGYKGNTRGCHIHESFVTLEETLLKIPERIPINIEIKYSVLWEAAKWQMDIWTIELNTFLDGILEEIYRCARSRVIIFSSFAPEICIALRFKQQDYPVLFLNEAGLIPTSDVRASSMQDAVHFARSWALDGIVEASDPLIFCPRLIGLTKSHDLICASWGRLNNDPKSAKIQAEAGLDAIIADDVHKISKALAGDLEK